MKVMEQRSSPDENELMWTVLCVLGFVIGLGSLGLFGWQTVMWLQNGEWTPVSLIDAAIWIGLEGRWLEQPDSWLGLWKLFNWLPTSGTGAVLSVVFILTSLSG